MRPAALVAVIGVAALLAPLAAEARPLTVGAGAGRIAAERDYDNQADHTLQVFGRIGVTSRVSGQLELQKIEGGTNVTVRTGTALIVVEMGQSGHLVPLMFGGLGIDHASSPYGTQKGSHIEGGFGLEYRFDGGLSLTADVRLGGRAVDQEMTLLADKMPTYVDLYAPTMVDGEYKSARIGLAIRL